MSVRSRRKSCLKGLGCASLVPVLILFVLLLPWIFPSDSRFYIPLPGFYWIGPSADGVRSSFMGVVTVDYLWWDSRFVLMGYNEGYPSERGANPTLWAVADVYLGMKSVVESQEDALRLLGAILESPPSADDIAIIWEAPKRREKELGIDFTEERLERLRQAQEGLKELGGRILQYRETYHTLPAELASVTVPGGEAPFSGYDPWGHPYHYRRLPADPGKSGHDASASTTAYELWSDGGDGVGRIELPLFLRQRLDSSSGFRHVGRVSPNDFVARVLNRDSVGPTDRSVEESAHDR